MRTSEGIALLFFAVMFAGCSRGTGPVAEVEKTVPVSGVVTYKGKPLEGFKVMFVPTDGRRLAAGITDAAGKFTLGTNDVGDGAPPGSHKVAVVWVPPESTAESGMEEPIDDPSKLPKPKVKIPPKFADPETSGLTQEVPDGGLDNVQIDLN